MSELMQSYGLSVEQVLQIAILEGWTSAEAKDLDYVEYRFEAHTCYED